MRSRCTRQYVFDLGWLWQAEESCCCAPGKAAFNFSMLVKAAAATAAAKWPTKRLSRSSEAKVRRRNRCRGGVGEGWHWENRRENETLMVHGCAIDPAQPWSSEAG